jgi:hypothetical protein
MRLPRGSLAIPSGLLLLVVALLALHTSTETSCDKARAQLSSGFLDRAEKQFTAILAQDPGSDCAGAGIAEVVGKRCTQAAGALKSGLRLEAAKAYGAILVTRPGRPCALKGVRAALVELCASAASLARDPGTAAFAAKSYEAIFAIEPTPTHQQCPVTPPASDGQTAAKGGG